jgi:hypothetical protein
LPATVDHRGAAGNIAAVGGSHKGGVLRLVEERRASLETRMDIAGDFSDRQRLVSDDRVLDGDEPVPFPLVTDRNLLHFADGDS